MLDIHGYSRRLESARRRLSLLEHSRLLLNFIDHLAALGLSKGRVAKYANHLCAIFRRQPFDPLNATRKDMELVIT